MARARAGRGRALGARRLAVGQAHDAGAAEVRARSFGRFRRWRPRGPLDAFRPTCAIRPIVGEPLNSAIECLHRERLTGFEALHEPRIFRRARPDA